MTELTPNRIPPVTEPPVVVAEGNHMLAEKNYNEISEESTLTRFAGKMQVGHCFVS